MFDKIAMELIANNKPLEFNSLSENLGEHLRLIFNSKLLQRFILLKSVDKKYVTVYYKGTKNILSLEAQKLAIKITLNAKYGTLYDENRVLKNVSNLGHWGSGDYQVKLEHPDDFVKVFDFIEQIYSS